MSIHFQFRNTRIQNTEINTQYMFVCMSMCVDEYLQEDKEKKCSALGLQRGPGQLVIYIYKNGLVCVRARITRERFNGFDLFFCCMFVLSSERFIMYF